MDRLAALQLAAQHFPNGPETIAAQLGAEIRLRRINIDGWCLRRPGGGALITLKDDAPETRRRFTLAHEVAHLILGTQSDVVGRRGSDLYDPRSPEEKEANQLGSELLLPPAVLAKMVRLPVDSRMIAQVAKRARVSEIVVALRLVRTPARFEMIQPVIARLEEGAVKWQIPISYSLPDDTAQHVYDLAVGHGGTHRLTDVTGKPMIALALSNPGFQVLLLYWLTAAQAVSPTFWERRKKFEDALFADDPNLRIRVNAFIGSIKPSITSLTTEQAFWAFYEKYGDRLTGEQAVRFHSATCYDYIRLRLSEYTVETE
ncbi:MAG TPA: ImmA/IrrE family metallo-endopeptidase [Urbifossiella sp.]|nr:ImmA/IrrE family metallo-endopeptidase [Urbifossiella sp.]